ncbi:hypothetical protein ACVIHH_002063 [Bradyrhizobium sp. USDA 4518]
MSPFEIAIIGTLMSLTRQQHGENNHQRALAAGAKGIERELAFDKTFADDWAEVKALRRKGDAAPAPMRQHVAPTFTLQEGHSTAPRYKPVNMGKALRNAGHHTYRQAKKRRRRAPMPDWIVVDVARTALLQAAGLTLGARNIARLDEALKTLSSPIKIDGEETPPFCVLEKFEGRLLLSISGEWLSWQYAKVPLPLPIKSSTATELLLWLQYINIYRSKGDSDYTRLAEKFGYDRAWRANRAVERALNYLNEHYLPKLNRGLLQKEHKIHLPDFYDVESEGARIRFVGREQGTYEHDRAMRKRVKKPKRRIERERLDDSPAADDAERKARLWRNLETRELFGEFE